MAWLRSLARTLVRDAHAAEDVVQDTWVAALGSGPRHLQGGRLRAWLATVARNVARRQHRDEANRRRHEEQCGESADPEVTDEVERLRLQRLVADQVLALREPYRTAVLLRYQEGLSYARIAKRENIRQETARRRVSRGIALLRERLDARFGGDPQAWCLALAPLARGTGTLPIGTTLTLGAISMGTKMAVCAAVLVSAAVGILWITGSGEQPLAPAPAEPDALTAQVELASPLSPEDSSMVATGRSVVSVESGPVGLGALATADPDRDLHGRVVDPDGNPVPEARLVVRRDDIRGYGGLDVARDQSGVVVAELASDAFGEFAIPLEMGRPYFLFVEKDGFAPTTRQDRYAGEFIEVRLDLGSTFAGRVVRAGDRMGIPARVRGRKRTLGVFDLFDARTEADGSFRFEGLESGEVFVDVFPEGAALSSWTTVQLSAGETVEHEFVCEPGVLVRGRVSDARNGGSVVGAEVSVGWTFDGIVATTDERGEYTIEHFPTTAIYNVAVRAAGYGRKERRLPAAVDGVATVNFELAPARQVVGRIVDGTGGAVEGAYVAAVASHFGDRLQKTDWLSARTGEDACFEISGIRPDVRHVLYIVCEGFATVAYDFPADEEHLAMIDVGTIVLQVPFVLRGVVVGSDGEPVPDCYVELTGMNEDRGLLGGTPMEDIEIYCGQRMGRTDHRGRFAFVDLAPAEYELGTRAPDARWRYERVRVRVGGERVQEIRVELEGGLGISGRVLDPGGEPLPDVMITVRPKPGTPGPGCLAQTDAAGRFRVTGLEPGLFQLTALPTDTAQKGRPAMLQAVVDVSSGSLPLEIHLRAAHAITGRVVDAQGRAVFHATVRAVDPEGKVAALALTEVDGSFTLALEGRLTVDLIATPPPEEGMFHEFGRVDPALGVRRETVAPGTSGLVLTLPVR